MMTMNKHEEIRAARAAGELLGTLTDRFGAAAVVDALGVAHVAYSLLDVRADDPEPNRDEDDE